MLLTVKQAVFWLMKDASDVVMTNAYAYIRIISGFYTVCFVVCSFVGLYRGLGMVHVPLIGTVLQISIRVVFSYMLIARMGLPAVALATGMGWIAFLAYQVILYKMRIRKYLQNG